MKIFYLCTDFHEEIKFSLDSTIEFEKIIDAIDSRDNCCSMESYHFSTDVSMSRVLFHYLDERGEFVDFIIVEFYDC